jgi:cell division protein FtsB
MSFLKNRKLRIYFFGLIFLFGLAVLFFNDQGVLKYLKLKNEVKEINEKIEAIDKENKQLETGIDSLRKKIPAKIERTAREEYNMIREGEKTIRIVKE